MTQPIYKRPYSKVSYYLFLWLHSIAFVIHTISFLLAYRYIPADSKLHVNLTAEEFTLEGPAESKTTPYDLDVVSYHKEEVDFIIEIGNTKQHFTNINPIRMIFYNELLTACSHFIALILLIIQEGVCIKEKDRITGVESEENMYPRPLEYNRRWLEYAITAGLLEIALAIVVGHTNAYILLSLLTLNVVQQTIGYTLDDLRYQELVLEINSEKISGTTRGGWFQSCKLKFVILLSGFTCLFSQAFILLNGGSFRLKNTNVNIDYEDDVQMVSVIYAILYSLFGLHMLFINIGDLKNSGKKRKNCWLDMFDGDAVFIILSCSVKILLSWLIISITYEMTDMVGQTDALPYMGPTQDDTDWKGARITYYVIGGFIFTVGMIITMLFTDSNLFCCYNMGKRGRDDNGLSFREYCCTWSGVRNSIVKAEKAVLSKFKKKEVEYTTIKF